MDRLKTQNLHCKRMLDRQLSDLDIRHRHVEMKRQREVRRLGLDLANLQKSTLGLDQVMGSPSASTSIDNSPRTSTPRRASFSGGFEPSNFRPSTSPALPNQRRGSVTSSVAHLLSRSRQELTSLSLTPISSPRSPRRHSVFDFRQQVQIQSGRRRKSSLPEFKRSSSSDTINNTTTTTNNNNNNNNHSFSSNSSNVDSNANRNNYNNNNNNNNNNNVNNNCVTPRTSKKPSSISIRINDNNQSRNNNNNTTADTTTNYKDGPRSLQRRHSSADVSKHHSSSVTTIYALNLNQEANHNKPKTTTSISFSSSGTTINTTTTTTTNKININNNSNNNIVSNNNKSTRSSNTINSSNNNSSDNTNYNNKQTTMTFGDSAERRGSKPKPSMISDARAQSTRRSSIGNPTTTSTTTSSTTKTSNNTNTLQESPTKPTAAMAGKSPTRLTARRGSADSQTSTSSSTSPRLQKKLHRLSIHSAEEVSHNETVVLIHRDDNEEPEIASSSSPECSESGSSMFSGKSKRRLSEPALGGHFLRALQSSAKESENDDRSSRHGHTGSASNGSGSCVTLRQVIEEELPSDIVAEEDEDRYNKETEKQETKIIGGGKNNLDKSDGHHTTNTTTKPSSSSDLSLSSSSSSSMSTSKTTKSKHSKDGNSKTENTNGGKSSQQRRRKSEGDVLKFARIWRLHSGNSETLRALLADDDKPEPINKAPVDTKDEIWDAVRKCRYIRGYEPAEMSEPSDVGEYVFGHQTTTPDASMAK